MVSEHAIGERHYATPEILEVERRLIDAAVSRTSEQTAVCSHDTLRATLAAHPTIGEDQAAMVRDITQGGQGVSVVVAKAGAGKTYALGVARHAWQLDGYRVLGAAPTGIATVCLDAEGFERSRTVDALLAELDQERAAEGRRRPGGRQQKLTRNSVLRKRSVASGRSAWDARFAVVWGSGRGRPSRRAIGLANIDIPRGMQAVQAWRRLDRRIRWAVARRGRAS